MGTRVLLALLLLAPSWAAKADESAGPGLSLAQAQSLGHKLEAIEKRQQTGGARRPETVVVTEGAVVAADPNVTST